MEKRVILKKWNILKIQNLPKFFTYEFDVLMFYMYDVQP